MTTERDLALRVIAEEMDRTDENAERLEPMSDDYLMDVLPWIAACLGARHGDDAADEARNAVYEAVTDVIERYERDAAGEPDDEQYVTIRVRAKFPDRRVVEDAVELISTALAYMADNVQVTA